MNKYPRPFGPYVLAAPLGDGGMGEVCLALSPEGDVCALKRIWRGEGPRADQEERFRREGEIARRLRHPSIARTVAIGDVKGELFIAEEFVEGVDLGNVSKGEIPIPVAVHLVIQVARALHYLHGFEGQGIVHRDVAPANIRLAFDGQVKLLDFGLVSAPALAGMTAPGQVIGRLPYLAPEVKRGLKGGAGADVYALGVVLWELLARRRFFEEQERARARHGPNAFVLPSQWNPEVSPELDQVVLEATVDEPTARFGSAQSLELALRPLVPPGFDGPTALRSLLRQLYDVDQIASATRSALDRARGMLGPPAVAVAPGRSLAEVRSNDATTERIPAGAPTASSEPGAGKRRVAVVGGLALIVLAGLVLTIPRWSGRPAPSPVVVVEPAASVAGPPPAPAAPAPASIEVQPTSRPVTEGARPRRRPERPVPASAVPEERKGGAEPGVDHNERDEAKRASLVRDAESRFHTKDLLEAEFLARRAIASGGGWREQHLLGQILFAQKRFADASEAFAESLRQNPQNAASARQLELARAAVRGEK